MKVDLKATNMDITVPIKSYVAEKLGGLYKYFYNIQQIDVEVGKTTKHHQKGKIFFCEVNLSVPRKLLRYREETDDLYKAINQAKKGIQQKIKEYKERLREAKKA
jgi:ribosomal subunit interface protein